MYYLYNDVSSNFEPLFFRNDIFFNSTLTQIYVNYFFLKVSICSLFFFVFVMLIYTLRPSFEIGLVSVYWFEHLNINKTYAQSFGLLRREFRWFCGRLCGQYLLFLPNGRVCEYETICSLKYHVNYSCCWVCSPKYTLPLNLL